MLILHFPESFLPLSSLFLHSSKWYSAAYLFLWETALYISKLRGHFSNRLCLTLPWHLGCEAGFSSSPSWEGRKGPQTLSFQDIALLKAVLAAGLYDSVGKIMCTKSVDVTEKLACMVETAQGKAQVHPSSVNRDLQTYGWLLYQEKVKALSAIPLTPRPPP